MTDRHAVQKTVLILCRELPPVGGGAGMVALELARQYRDSGLRIVYVTMHYCNLPEREHLERSIEVFRVRCRRRHQDSSYLFEMFRFVLAAAKPVRNICQRRSIAFIHAHAILPEGLLALAAKRWAGGAPILTTSHGSDVPGHNPDRFRLAHKLVSPIWHQVIKRFTVLSAPGSHQARLIESIRPGIQVHVIPNGVHPNLFADVPSDRDGSLLIVSRLTRTKNYHEFFKALRHISIPLQLHVVGDGPTRSELEEQASTLRQHEVTFHGWVPHGSLEWKRLYRTASYFVFPSVTENFSMGLLEAQLAGLLVLATPIPANIEVLGNHAKFFEGVRASDMVRTLTEIAGSAPSDYKHITSAARERVIANFSWKEIGKRYLSAVERRRGNAEVEKHAPSHATM